MKRMFGFLWRARGNILYFALIGILIISLIAVFVPKAQASGWLHYEKGQTRTGFVLARPGSGFDCNAHFDLGRFKYYTSCMGITRDGPPTSIICGTRLDSDGSIQRFDPSDQEWTPYWDNTQIEVMPDRRRLYGAHCRPGTNDVQVYTSVATISPFAGFSKDINNPNMKISLAPFFYKEVALYNNTGVYQSGKMFFSIDYATGYAQNGNTKTIYYQVPSDNGGLRALAIQDPSATWGYGDGIFDYFAATSSLPNCHVGSSIWNAGGFSVPFGLRPGEEKIIRLVYAGYNGGDVMQDVSRGGWMRFLYGKLFPAGSNQAGVNQVIDYAFSNKDEIMAKTNAFAAKYMTGNSMLDFIISMAIQNYLANGWMVYDPRNGNVYYYVSEGGDCQFLSTIDVGHDTAVFEVQEGIEALRKQLEEWEAYVLSDQYGIYLQHDMGVETQVIPGQVYPFNMGVEEILNRNLLLHFYWKKSGDIAFMQQKLARTWEFISSLKARSAGSGIVHYNAYKTTFDYEAASGGTCSLGEASENTYIAVKQFANYIACAEMFLAVGDSQKADVCYQEANKIKETLKGAYRRFGYLPVSLSYALPDWSDQSVVIFDGLLTLFLTDSYDPNGNGTGDALIRDLLVNVAPSHYYALNVCRRAYGYSVTSSADETWLSKCSFNATTISGFFEILGFYGYEGHNEVLSDAASLLQNSELGFVDCWNVDAGAALNLTLYPRGACIVGLSEGYSNMVKLLYRRWLGREPDPGGYDAHLNALRTGAMNPTQVTNSVRYSYEYCDRYVSYVFVTMFGYDQDVQGHNAYVNAMLCRVMSETDIYWEFYRASIIWKVYKELLYRAPDDDGLSTFTNAMKAGMTEQQVRESIMSSDEYKRLHPNG
ncbi:MAG: hypothetical protein PHI88_01460 [Candidatus Pacebacteria bacterium]|nr:hypothetical protein [Candidatus Paceibacterota bacterium]